MRDRGPGARPVPRALRKLAEEHLGLAIQEGERSPVDDARAALYLYLQHRKVGQCDAVVGRCGIARTHCCGLPHSQLDRVGADRVADAERVGHI